MDATTTVYASGMSQPSELNGCDKFVYVPFWLVKTTSDETLANMRYASTTVDDLAIAILQSTRAVHPYERLLVLQEKAKAKAPLRGALVPEANAEAKAAPTAVPTAVPAGKPPAVPTGALVGRGKGKLP